MKRSVAILGPTPQFVRWAILHSCPLRQIDQENLPDTTFRQLRGLRELSVGIIEDRVLERICIHPDASSQTPMSALGFPIAEALDAYGDQEFIAECCERCCANAYALDEPGVWAGCYGWLPASDQFSFEITSNNRNKASSKPRSATQTNESKNEFPEMLDEIVKDSGRTEEADRLFQKTSPRWYGIWQAIRLDRHQIEFLRGVFDEMVSRVSTQVAGVSKPHTDLVRFRNALTACSRNALELHVELIPPGISDGINWTQFAHCPACKHKMKSDSQGVQTCPACKRQGNAHGERKGKVLGLRPYVNLCSVLGKSRTIEVLQQIETRKQRGEMGLKHQNSRRNGTTN